MDAGSRLRAMQKEVEAAARQSLHGKMTTGGEATVHMRWALALQQKLQEVQTETEKDKHVLGAILDENRALRSELLAKYPAHPMLQAEPQKRPASGELRAAAGRLAASTSSTAASTAVAGAPTTIADNSSADAAAACDEAAGASPSTTRSNVAEAMMMPAPMPPPMLPPHVPSAAGLGFGLGPEGATPSPAKADEALLSTPNLRLLAAFLDDEPEPAPLPKPDPRLHARDPVELADDPTKKFRRRSDSSVWEPPRL